MYCVGKSQKAEDGKEGEQAEEVKEEIIELTPEEQLTKLLEEKHCQPLVTLLKLQSSEFFQQTGTDGSDDAKKQIFDFINDKIDASKDLSSQIK